MMYDSNNDDARRMDPEGAEFSSAPRTQRTSRRVVVDGREGTRRVDPQRGREDGRRPASTRQGTQSARSAQGRDVSSSRQRPGSYDSRRVDSGRQDGRRPNGGQQRPRGSASGRQGERTAASRRQDGQRPRGESRLLQRQAPRQASRQTVRRDLPQRSRGGRSLQVGVVKPNFNSLETSHRPQVPRIAIIIAAIILILIIVFAVRACSAGAQEGADKQAAEVTAAAETEGTAGGEGGAAAGAGATANRVSFVAVGDNLPDDLIGYWADAQTGGESDGTYDYTGLYKYIKPYVEKADLAYVKQETHLGGNEIGPKGYPSFNTTDEMADAIVDAGFDFVASATNHAYDWGLYGALDNSLAVWESKPVAFTGTSVTEEQYNRIATLERNGITFALLDYTYGVNWPDDMELPAHSINLIDEDRIASDVARAKEEADVVLVAMHWGTELLMEADEEQQHLAQFLANLDVDVVLGSHPHVIGPVAWVANEDGSGHKTLVAYSLGNFLSDHENRSPEVELEGMLCCDFVRSSDNSASEEATAEGGEDTSDAPTSSAGTIEIENVKWVPLVNHTNADRSDFAVYALKDYSNALATQNLAYADNDVKDPVKWLRDKTKEVIGSVVPIDDGQTIVSQDVVDTFAFGIAASRNAANAAAITVESTQATS